jgi:hypothetical protein
MQGDRCGGDICETSILSLCSVVFACPSDRSEYWWDPMERKSIMSMYQVAIAHADVARASAYLQTTGTSVRCHSKAEIMLVLNPASHERNGGSGLVGDGTWPRTRRLKRGRDMWKDSIVLESTRSGLSYTT